MQITMDNFKFAHRRLSSDKKNSIIIPWSRIEDIIYSSAKKMFENNSISRCLSEANSQIRRILSMYGHV
jgi:hypothetical protein